MQCDFTTAELITLDLAIMNRAIMAKESIANHQGDKAVLEVNIKRLEALHKKLEALIAEAKKGTTA